MPKNEMNWYSSIASAFIGVTASHPIDTLKTNQQISGDKLSNVIRNMNKDIFNSKNISQITKNFTKQYYRGLKYPIIFTPIEKGIVFNVDNYLYKKFNNRIYSGLGAGIIGGFFVNFMENLKINEQNIYNKNNISKLNLLNPKVYTKGLNQTLLREGIGYTIYFKTFNDYYKPNLPTFIAGGLSGVTAWVVIYPFDRVKTLVQSGNSVKHLNWLNIYKGCSLSLLRAIIMHGSVFYFVEKLNLYP